MELWELLLIFLVGIKALTVIEGRPSVTEAESPSDKANLEADQFLTSYGYYPASGPLPAQEGKPSLRKHSDTERTKALKLLQKFYHLPQSGQLDKETKELMQSRRCGHPDILSNPSAKGTPTGFRMEEEVSQSRKENKTEDRDELGMSINRERRSLGLPTKRLDKGKILRRDERVFRWGNKKRHHVRRGLPTLYWKIQPMARGHMPTKSQSVQIQWAVTLWQLVVPVIFVKKDRPSEEEPDLIFYMEPPRPSVYPPYNDPHWLYTHSSGKRIQWFFEPRPGQQWFGQPKPKQGTEREDERHAHTMHPISQGKLHIHFDANHKWTDQELLSTALHEIGHVLGLSHSDDSSAVMYAYNRNATAFTIADINSIEMLYGPPIYWQRMQRSFACLRKLNKVDTIFMDPINSMNGVPYYYVISGNYVQRFLPPGILSNKAPIAEMFPGAPSNYDVVFSHPSISKCVYFIKGKTLYTYKDDKWLPTEELKLPKFPIRVAVTIEGYRTRRGEKTLTLLFGNQKKKSWVFEYDGEKVFTYKNRRRPKIIKKLLAFETKLAVQWPRGGPVYFFKETAKRSGIIGYFIANFGKNSKTKSSNPDDLRIHYETTSMYFPPWFGGPEGLCGTSHATCNRMSSASVVLVTILSLIRLY